jgi:hypothetical protein
MVSSVHDECGAPVAVWAGRITDPDGGEHQCRDYLAWHQPPDRRDPDLLDVADGWKPRRRELKSAA